MPKRLSLKSGVYENFNFEKRSISDKLFENGKKKVQVAGCRVSYRLEKQISQ